MLQCNSDVFFEEARAIDRKGITIDDTTLQFCPLKIPELWPNSQAPIVSMRLFRAWNAGWSRNYRRDAWDAIAKFIVENGMKVLMATPITCDKVDDEKSWQWTKEFMRKIGPSNVMGFSVGNELELLYSQDSAPQNCIREMWDGGGFWMTFQKRVKEIDDMGFSAIPVTSVFTAGILYQGYPFVNNPGQALVSDFLANATEKYVRRYAFTFNIYPYFDPDLQLDLGSNHSCNEAKKKALCWERGCLAHESMTKARRHMKALTKRDDDLFWIGEIGWSAPKTDALNTHMAACPSFSSVEAVSTFYSGFLRWDLSLEGYKGPDHVFYFTLRDAMNFGHQEHFGMMTTCESFDCKILSANWTSPQVVYSVGPKWLQKEFGLFGLVLLLITFVVWVITAFGCMNKRSAREKDLLSDEHTLDDRSDRSEDESSGVEGAE